ncbi:MAG: hypothetical protein FWC67_05350 [Defluviitaleaceae bacterium]|nr:hypothetical protein [Defluviitaleaceae bacterium]
MAATAQILEAVKLLSNEQKDIVYTFVMNMISPEDTNEDDFDYYSDEDIKEIKEAKKRMDTGEYYTYTAEELDAIIKSLE